MRKVALLLALALPLACTSVPGRPGTAGLAWQSQPQAAPARSVTLTHVRLELELDLVGQRLGGIATCWVRALGRGASEVRLTGPVEGVREVLDARGRSLAFRSTGPGGGLLVELAEPLPAGRELPLSVAFSLRSAPGLLFGETPRGPGWTPWVVAGPAAGSNAPWFPMVEAAEACASFEADVLVGQRARVLLGGLPSSAGEVVEGSLDGTHLYRFRFEAAVHLERLGLVAGRFESAGKGPTAARVFAMAGTTAESLARLVEQVELRERGLDKWLSPAPAGRKICVVAIPDARAQRLGSLGCVSLAPSVVRRLARGDAFTGLDPLAMGLARSRVAGWHGATRPSEAWILEGLAAHLALQMVGDEAARERALQALAPLPGAWREQTIGQLSLRAGGTAVPESVAARGAWLLYKLEQEVGAEALSNCLRQALGAQRGNAFGEADLLQFFRAIDGRDLAPALNELVNAYGPVPEVVAPAARP